MQNDLISRKSLIGRLAYYHAHSYGKAEYAYGVAVEEVAKAPAIDAVPVVRCKDCKYHRNAGCPMRTLHVAPYGYKVNDSTTDNGFCHMGAKMDGGAADA